jgi:hypothetical protein
MQANHNVDLARFPVRRLQAELPWRTDEKNNLDRSIDGHRRLRDSSSNHCADGADALCATEQRSERRSANYCNRVSEGSTFKSRWLHGGCSRADGRNNRYHWNHCDSSASAHGHNGRSRGRAEISADECGALRTGCPCRCHEHN